jgi:hypothetical protein
MLQVREHMHQLARDVDLWMFFKSAATSTLLLAAAYSLVDGRSTASQDLCSPKDPCDRRSTVSSSRSPLSKLR